MPKSEASVKGLSLGEMFKDVGILGGFVVCYLLTLFCQNALQIKTDAAYAIGAVLIVALGIISRQIQKPSLESFAGLGVCAIIAVYFQSAFQLSTGAGMAIGLALVLGLASVMQWPLGSFLLFTLFITHALVGAVELGTDGWIQNITGNLFTSEQGKYLFMWTSAIMFSLRFCANFIEKRLGISPVGILVTCAILACIGLNLASGMTSIGVAFLALSVYAVGKTFFWPTMLAVASDRFPRTGAIAISIMGGIGMLSAGMIGSPGLGYAKDRFATEALAQSNPAALEQYKAAKPSKFLFFSETSALDGTKLAEAQKVAADQRTPEQKAVAEASIAGDRKTLKADSFIPAAMAAIYLLLLVYFKTIGGYKAVHIVPVEEQAKAN